MIVFDLECSQGHVFEGWFESLEAYEDQREGGLISCPYCDDARVKRILSPVAVKKAAPARQDLQEAHIDYKRLAREVVEYVHQNFEDVGPQFTSEALKIHYGVSERRNIRGSATENEEKLLKEEGVEFFKLPVPSTDPKKKN
ncbi:MAG: DUF1178 domain-containing protein [Thermoplasmata archaeon]|nr:MAG: hypothetical protein B1H13_09120 [Desulfobacteraceae bacterium 4484_190.3]RLB17577.1 MAG: DUF1178 domain-containing protein [Deltaproteobacteria bacterium]RLF56893.1 MAG: DUF1178 domain-containing protein [Thermoplasmata archaeon]HDZ23143.1 DUF1178 family protein [Desulfobacteraceae bacterium]